MIEFALPDVGEGLTEAEIVTWHVVVGDSVEINDTLVEIETAKSIVELPSPAAGVISSVHVDEGKTVDVGTILISIDDGVAATGDQSSAGPAEAQPSTSVAPPESAVESPQVLVGTGPSAAVPRRKRLGSPASPSPAPAPAATPTTTGSAVRAKPPVRLLARQLGVDLANVVPSEDGIVSRSDVERAASGVTPPQVAAEARGQTRIPIKGVRKMTAAAMTSSAFTAPHVTEWLTVDITRSMDILARLKQDRAWAGVRLTPLVLVARAFLLAVRRFPDINSQWDETAQEIVLHHTVNLGIAAATPRGLIVPNIKDADRLDLTGLAHAMESLVHVARSGKTPQGDMANGTITITNIGALGVDAGTPILNPGEAAILAFGSVREMPWVVDGQIVARKVTQLAMSFDHRLVDGELGSHVLAEVGRLLSDPGETFLYV